MGYEYRIVDDIGGDTPHADEAAADALTRLNATEGWRCIGHRIWAGRRQFILERRREEATDG
jgi:hypothetical protein